MAKFRYLTTPFRVKNLELKNRVVMPPMCTYSATDGVPNDWHFVHYSARAIGGVGLIIVEMTNIAPNGRITPNCLGLWNDEQRDAFKRIVAAAHQYGSKIAIQIAHAGRKALGHDYVDAPSPILYDGDDKDPRWSYQTPRDLSTAEVKGLVQKYAEAVKRAVEAGFDAIEIHGAHGYLIHEFHSFKANQRSDEYGQDKMLFGEQVIQAAKAVMPAEMPLLVRISAQEYGKDGYSKEHGLEVAKRYAAAGADVLHVSGGGDGTPDPAHSPSIQAGYQVHLARAVKQATGKPTIAVGMLEDPALADYVLASGDADLVAIGRGLLRDPHWLLNAQYHQNGKDSAPMQFVPRQYQRGF
ncbi:NADH:flavin oxidoreductase/NADH oxidase [Testudinibacter sp. TR-2022]|uniref:NADH:flavin oxidoreductase/NADH oxidase n=1 Tax=Testudinibacter sp. TR-2022 TaxID=2585029 RepID=UPI00111ABC8E|nr:NADH:flavin oxidoreductase/NADH oxidase [Testudinibacter sp. TR-2022]TNH02451.1 NADH:flavin oxidoreductase/NADH oxidase [Pasteurellaceae bacterium Phil31]TNH09893.1 NADH:flavin oxidoreductase/NADH oxidase [Testudinibacter sp. TR-2022]TNH10575.1 NADH:flavin oxidoreductase/NADH oxidase [Testudinibacter sp. TR-2022]TNH13646.1 NADH:flavin oxidoreductase/NADH oxidase [Testudinibacter sp. TR-2022]TNH18146.1 NADH:flavin oxidoreductase/NADH oxidase [Testudinibacter sp. TR-2022]